MEKITMRERILASALKLFSEKGYAGVSVDQIAEAVGIKGPALYNHFKGKESILNSLSDVAERHYKAYIAKSEAELRAAETPEDLFSSSLEQINFLLQDPLMVRIRRMIYMEQFRSPRFAELASYHLFRGLYELYTGIFEDLIAQGRMRQGSPAMLALRYVSPVSALMQICDREPGKYPEIMEQIRAHAADFMNACTLPDTDTGAKEK